MARTCLPAVRTPWTRRSGSWIKRRCRRILVGDDSDKIPCVLIVMGVSGAGKSTIGEKLAERLGWIYEDGDRFHPATNVATISTHQPFTPQNPRPSLHPTP